MRPPNFEPDARLASIADEKVWIDESFKAAKADVYVQPIGVGAGPFALTDGYKSAALSLAKQRVALAGTRLANLLNAALKGCLRSFRRATTNSLDIHVQPRDASNLFTDRRLSDLF